MFDSSPVTFDIASLLDSARTKPCALGLRALGFG